MIKTLKKFFTRFWDVMTGDGWEDPEVLGFIDQESDSKSYLEISKNSKYKRKLPRLCIDLVPDPARDSWDTLQRSPSDE
tara:strand:+ start:67 stop:303 length:237 start_codon:yes stop_codon:yes gene_type:complete